TLEQAKEFLRLVALRTGQKPVIYSGSLLKDRLKRADPFLADHRLWLSEYGPGPGLPPGWSTHWLWPDTGGGKGPGPPQERGSSTKGIDLSVYAGENLASDWVHKIPPWAPPAPSRTSSRSSRRRRARR